MQDKSLGNTKTLIVRLILFLCMSLLYGFLQFPFAVASFPGHVGETAWQLPQVQTVELLATNLFKWQPRCSVCW